MSDAVQTEATSIPAWMVREIEALTRRVSRDPQACQLSSALRKLGLEMVITVQPITSAQAGLRG